MDLRQIRALVAVADHQSFSAAARSLHTVQSNVSTHIARLERELRATLVDRATGKLTHEGEAVVTRARRIEEELDAITADISSMVGEIAGTVRVGVIGTTARWLVPHLLERAETDYPKLRIIIVDATTTSLVPQVVEGRLDAALVNLPVSNPDIETDPVFEEDRIVVAPRTHPIAAAEDITLAELVQHPLLLPPRGTTFRDSADAEAAARGLDFRIHAEVDGVRLLASLAFQGFGAALLPASAAPGHLVDSAWKRVQVTDLARRSVGLVTNRRSSPAAPARVVRQMIRETVTAKAGTQPGIYPLDDSGSTGAL
jgi:LysR family hydrogen peroxide-inducible transcriptional activator